MQEITKEDILARLALDNPWWATGAVQPVYARWTPRPYLELFLPRVTYRAVRRAVVLMGPRRVGKTVLLHHTIARLLAQGIAPRRICYVSLDNPLYDGLFLEKLLSFYLEGAGDGGLEAERFIFFDEVQYLAGWEIHLKSLVDSYPALQCIASGSAAAALRLKSRESGAGRFTDFLLPPLTFYEYLSLGGELGAVDLSELLDLGERVEAAAAKPHTDIEALNRRFVDYLNFGGYPEVGLSAETHAEAGRFIKSDIIDKVLLRDLPGLYGIEDSRELNSLFTTLAFNTAQEISLEQLAKSSGVAKATLRRYLEYLEAAFLIRTVHRVDKNARSFERAVRFKVYLTNPSIRSALFAPVAADGEAVGHLVETAIFAQWFHSPDASLRYARWDRGEVDIVSLSPEQRAQWAVEVKWSDRAARHPEDLKEVFDFCRRNGLPRVTITTRTLAAARQDRGLFVRFYPAALYCLVVGSNAIVEQGRAELWPRPVFPLP